jgi:hypothetical protein
LNKSILNTEIQEFIYENLNSNISSLLLKGTSFSDVETKDIIEQIEAKNVAIKNCQHGLKPKISIIPTS